MDRTETFGTAGAAKSQADRLEVEVRSLTRRVDRLTIVAHALWELLRDNTDLTDIDIKAKILEVDEHDGAVDGKLQTPSSPCVNCGRPNNVRRCTCLYCGALITTDNALGL
jgi:hypothetical protein